MLLLSVLRPAPLSSAGSVSDIAWTDVQVGDFLMVKDDELFPADMVCIYSALPDKVRWACCASCTVRLYLPGGSGCVQPGAYDVVERGRRGKLALGEVSRVL